MLTYSVSPLQLRQSSSGWWRSTTRPSIHTCWTWRLVRANTSRDSSPNYRPTCSTQDQRTTSESSSTSWLISHTWNQWDTASQHLTPTLWRLAGLIFYTVASCVMHDSKTKRLYFIYYFFIKRHVAQSTSSREAITPNKDKGKNREREKDTNRKKRKP